MKCDVLILGAGLAGGLPAAAYLQKAGLSVTLVERAIETGKFYQSYDLLPGVRFDHSPVNFSAMSPAMLDLDLERHGYAPRLQTLLHSVTTMSGTNITFYPDLDRTTAALARFSARDAARFRRLMEGLAPHWEQLVRMLFFSPHPDPHLYAQAVALTAEAIEMDVDTLRGHSAISLMEELFESETTRLFLIPLAALNLFGDLLAPEQGALSWIWSNLLRACVVPAGNQSLPKTLERVFLHHGGRLLRNTEARRLHLVGGVCRGADVSSYGGGPVERIEARAAVISNLGASLTLNLLGESSVSGHFGGKLSAWSTAKRVLAVHDFVLRRMPAWTAEAGNPDFGRAPRIYLIWDSWRECVRWLENAHEDEETFHNDVELTLLGNIYPGSAGGRVPLRVRHGTGPYSRALESKRDVFTERMLMLLERFNPQLPREILAHQMATPLDFWRSNPAALHGNPVGGDYMQGQWVLDRCPYRSPIERLYLSNSVWPTAMSWMAPGYNAASVVADDLGLQRPDWWRHGAGDWLARQRERQA